MTSRSPASGAAAPQTIMRGPREWDADAYHRLSDFQTAWGLEVLDRLDLAGSETVLDAGCGTGRVTGELVARLPRGHVIAVDASADMLRKARENLPRRCELRQADLAALELDTPVDAILSTAVFHWLPDHDRLFARLAAALHPGGRLVAQCGGEGNVASLGAAVRTVAAQESFAFHLDGWKGPWNFSSAEAAAARLERAGFVDVDCRLEPKTVAPEDPRAFLAMVTLGVHLERLPARLRELFLDAVLAALPRPVRLDYVRLNIDAALPGAA